MAGQLANSRRFVLGSSDKMLVRLQMAAACERAHVTRLGLTFIMASRLAGCQAATLPGAAELAAPFSPETEIENSEAG